MNTYLNIHDVETVELFRQSHDTFHSLTFTMTTKDGEQVEVVLFSSKQLKIEEVEL